MLDQIPIQLDSENSLESSCERSRKFLVRTPSFHVLALYHYSDEPVFPPHQEEHDKAVSHHRSCTKCLTWIKAVVPEEIMKRQSQLSQYCCSQLFAAVEEKSRGKLKINLDYYSPPNYEGAHNWKLTISEYPEIKDSMLINYCPFCGDSIKVAGKSP